ncbi:hypothetical protein [Phnomibacter sp. MR]|uniref:hypothetical protein n=1 Tax=Phnomibacter sp. MR TaxID=3042318 RepID=UPI003A807149
MQIAKLWILIITACCIQFAAQAQPKPGQQLPVAERVSRTLERLKPELNLNAQQVKDMTPVYRTFYTDMDKLRSNGQQPTTEERTKLIDKRDSKLKTILQATQFAKLKALEEEVQRKIVY